MAIAYPRRQPAEPEQAKTLITYTENQVTNKPNDKLGDLNALLSNEGKRAAGW